jgi:signal transduction histidine kinase
LSETIGLKKQKQEPVEEDIDKIRQYSHEMIDKMGEIVWALNEKNDSLSDLLAYTRVYAMQYLSENGIHCSVDTPVQFPSSFISGEFRRNIYLTVKEALHNIVKHAQAREVIIQMETGKMLLISISDDGTGFDQKNIRPYGNGLNNMKKRMESIEGMLEIKNGNGTTIIISAPIG